MRKCVLAVLLAVAMLLGYAPAAIAAEQPKVTQATTIYNALAGVNGLLAQSAKSAVTTTVDVPRDADSGVTVTQGGKSTNIMLPGAKNAGNAMRVAAGITAYASGPTAQAVQSLNDGSVRMLTVIKSASAPVSYSYGFNAKSHTGEHFVVLANGSALLLDARSKPIGAVAKPWAKDSRGKSVATRYVAVGSSLTQVVDHRTKGIAYPVVADPFWIPAWAVLALVKCGVGGYIGWISSGGYRWYERAIAVAGSCFLARKA